MNPEDNFLLRSLDPETRQALVARCTTVDLPLHKQLVEPDQQPKRVYFPTAGFASVVIALPDRGSAEVALIGRDGIVGGLQLLGPATMSANVFIQMKGEGYSLPFEEMREMFTENAGIRARVLEFTQAQAVTMGQLAACNKLHDAESRLARWLLMVDDRMLSDTISLTQEFLAQMLGTQRTTVVMAAGALQRSGIISYSRGKLAILSRELLEEAACDCYPVMRTLYKGLYRQPLA